MRGVEVRGQGVRHGVIHAQADVGEAHGADGHDGVGLGGLEGLDAVGDVLDGGVGLDVGVDAVGDAGLVEQIGDLGRDAELHQVGVGADEHLLVAAARELARNLGDCAGPMTGDGVENDAVCHDAFLSTGCNGARTPCPRAPSCMTPSLYDLEQLQSRCFTASANPPPPKLIDTR